MRWPPSKDHRDYQTPGRWEGRGLPRWLAWLGSGSRMPYRYTLASGLVGLALGAAFGAIVGWDQLPPALFACVLAQFGAELWWWRRAKR
jgi:hypothetical protein